MDYLRGLLGDDAKFGNATLTPQERFELASPVTSAGSAAFRLLQRAILETLGRDRVRCLFRLHAPLGIARSSWTHHPAMRCNGQVMMPGSAQAPACCDVTRSPACMHARCLPVHPWDLAEFTCMRRQ